MFSFAPKYSNLLLFTSLHLESICKIKLNIKYLTTLSSLFVFEYLFFLNDLHNSFVFVACTGEKIRKISNNLQSKISFYNSNQHFFSKNVIWKRPVFIAHVHIFIGINITVETNECDYNHSCS